jgi:hypothetical protein
MHQDERVLKPLVVRHEPVLSSAEGNHDVIKTGFHQAAGTRCL